MRRSSCHDYYVLKHYKWCNIITSIKRLLLSLYTLVGGTRWFFTRKLVNLIEKSPSHHNSHIIRLELWRRLCKSLRPNSVLTMFFCRDAYSSVVFDPDCRLCIIYISRAIDDIFLWFFFLSVSRWTRFVTTLNRPANKFDWPHRPSMKPIACILFGLKSDRNTRT